MGTTTPNLLLTTVYERLLFNANCGSCSSVNEAKKCPPPQPRQQNEVASTTQKLAQAPHKCHEWHPRVNT